VVKGRLGGKADHELQDKERRTPLIIATRRERSSKCFLPLLLGDEAVVQLPALGGVVGGQVAVATAERDDGAISGFVKAVAGIFLAILVVRAGKRIQYGTGYVGLSGHTTKAGGLA
jgi:hypothetical protein